MDNSGICWKAFLAGCIAGAVDLTITAPLDFAKTQIQLDARYAKCGMKKKYNGVFDCLDKNIKKHGFRELYSGLPAALLASVPKMGVRFGSYEEFRRRVADKNGRITQINSMMCGVGAGVVEAILIVTPMESLEIKMINDVDTRRRFQGKTFTEGATIIIREQGIRSLYQGVIPTVIKQGSNQGIRFWVMEALKDRYRNGDPSVPIPKLMIGVFGAAAGAASVFGNTPVDVIKTRLQSLEAKKKYAGFYDCARKIYRHEGPAAFYKGFLARLNQVTLDVAITFIVYDTLIDVLNAIWS